MGQEQKTFQRGLLLTVIGLCHAVFGFCSVIWSLIVMGVVGYYQAFTYGYFYGIMIYIYEYKSLLLWASGIGILRAKKWGTILGLAWCLLSIFFIILNHIIRSNNWGIASPKLSWGEYAIIYYTIFYLIKFFIYPFVKEKHDFDIKKYINFNFIKSKTKILKSRMQR